MKHFIPANTHIFIRSTTTLYIQRPIQSLSPLLLLFLAGNQAMSRSTGSEAPLNIAWSEDFTKHLSILVLDLLAPYSSRSVIHDESSSKYAKAFVRTWTFISSFQWTCSGVFFGSTVQRTKRSQLMPSAWIIIPSPTWCCSARSTYIVNPNYDGCVILNKCFFWCLYTTT